MIPKGSHSTRLTGMLTMLIIFLFTSVPAVEVTDDVEVVVISASRVEENIKDTVATVNALSSEDLESIKYRNPQELLARIPGIYSHNFGNESELTSIRVPTHFSNPYTLILIDGVPISGYGSGSSGQFSEINPNSVERIEVVKGPASALYGSNAIGGVINMVSRKPAGQPQGDINLEYGADASIRSSASVSAFTRQVGLLLDANYKDNEGWRDHSDFEKKGANLMLHHSPTDNSTLSFKMDYLDKSGATPGSLKQGDFSDDWRQSYNTFAYSEMTRITPRLTYSLIFPTGELSTTLAYRDVESSSIPDYSIRRQGPAHVGSKYRSDENATNIQLLYHRYIEFADSRVIVGLDGETGTREADTYGLSVEWDPAANRYTGYTDNGLSKSFNIETKVIAPYLQWELRPAEKLKLNLGGRYDNTTYGVEDKLATTNQDSEFSRVTPKAGLVYDFNSGLNGFLSYSQGFVVPTSSQLLTSSWANEDLSPEKADNYELGLRSNLLGKRLALNLAVFFMEIQDKIISQDVGMYLKQYVNAGETSQKGIELTSQFQANRWFSLGAAYTFARNRYEELATGSDDFSGNTPPRSPEHRFNLRVATTPLKNMRIELEMDAVSSEYSDDANLFEYSRPTLLNLRTAYDWSSWSLWGHVLNLTDRQYSSYSSFSSSDGVKYYPGTPLTLFAGISYSWSK
ncbi:MAG: TonB-dependent receptor [bacterium]|nr:TonB-dependent receptor [bacterium]